jgi:TRAP-type C4-dicarboxylate transport system permease large subunit
MTIFDVSAGMMLLFGGLWTGAVLIVALERTAIWQRMSLEQYAVDFRRSLLRSGPILTILGLAAAIAAIVFAVHSNGHARELACAGVAGFVLVVVASIVFAAPIEAQFRRNPEGHVPEKAEHYRLFWRRFHAGRTLVALLVFGGFIVAALYR